MKSTATCSHFTIKPILPLHFKVGDKCNLEKFQFRHEITMHFVNERFWIDAPQFPHSLCLCQQQNNTARRQHGKLCDTLFSPLSQVFSSAAMFSKLLSIKLVPWCSVGSHFHKKYLQINYQSLTYFTLCYTGLALIRRLSFVEVFQYVAYMTFQNSYNFIIFNVKDQQ